MSNTQENPTYRTQDKTEEQSIDIRSLVYIFLNRWYFFLICVFIAVALGWVYNFLKTPLYQVNGTVLVKSDRTMLDPTSIMTGVYYGNMQNVDNELAVLKSYSLSEKVVKKMNLEVSYFDRSGIRTFEYYKNSPFIIEFDKQIPQAVGLLYEITISGDVIKLHAEAKSHSEYDYENEQFIVSGVLEEVNINGEYKIGEWIDTGYNRFIIRKNSNYNTEIHDNRLFGFNFNDYLSLTKSMSFTAAAISKQASVITLTMTGSNTRKIVDFLNNLMNEYINRGLERKNMVSENTIEFIDQQLAETESALTSAELNLQEYRSSHDLTNLNAQSSQIITTLKGLEEEHAAMLVNMQYYKRLQSYMRENIDNPDNLAAPSAMGIADPLLNKLVQDLVNLNQQKALQLLTVTDQHPVIVKLDEQIVTTKRTILENINNLVDNAQLGIDDIENRIRKVEGEARNLPQKERLLIGYERKFTLSQETYNYLMQRRAEAQIIKASNTPDNEVIDYANVQRAIKVAPKSSMNYLIAFIIGMLIPALFLFLKDFFNTKIMSRKDIEKLTDFPIIGQIGMLKTDDPCVVIAKPKSPTSEAFRSIRTNIDFLTQGSSKCTILVTGDMQSVGKTFNSINIASIYALYGKKTILLGFDLRKPKLFQEFGLSNNIGITSFLSNKNTLDEVIQNSNKIECLDLITSGPIPPNPAELIASSKCDELFRELKERYDYIIIDTPPLGLVTDAFLLMKHTDVNLYIVRQGHTDKNVFATIIKDIEDRNLKVSIIVNGIRQDSSYGYGKYRYGYGGYGSYGYGYGYGYGYSYGYGHYGHYGEDAAVYYGEESHDHSHDKKKGLFGKSKHHHHHHSK